MATKVSLRILVNGRVEAKSLDFDKPVHGLVGREYDCLIEFPDTPDFFDISRHHCELDIDPPHVRVRDAGSRNGTYVNDELIGQRGESVESDDVDPEAFTYRDLKDGDTLLLGTTVICVRVTTAQDAVYELRPDAGVASAGTVAQVGDTMSDLSGAEPANGAASTRSGERHISAT